MSMYLKKNVSSDPIYDKVSKTCHNLFLTDGFNHVLTGWFKPLCQKPANPEYVRCLTIMRSPGNVSSTSSIMISNQQGTLC